MQWLPVSTSRVFTVEVRVASWQTRTTSLVNRDPGVSDLSRKAGARGYWAGWPGGWLAGWVAGWLVQELSWLERRLDDDRLAGRPAGWLAGWVGAGWALAGWRCCWLGGWVAGSGWLAAGWLANSSGLIISYTVYYMYCAIRTNTCSYQ